PGVVARDRVGRVTNYGTGSAPNVRKNVDVARAARGWPPLETEASRSIATSEARALLGSDARPWLDPHRDRATPAKGEGRVGDAVRIREFLGPGRGHREHAVLQGV